MRNRPEIKRLFGLKKPRQAGKEYPLVALTRPATGAVNGTRMTELPSKPISKPTRKITDDPYGAAILIRRLVMEQGFVYWRRYLTAFALMGVSAGATAGSAYILGQVINQAYIDKNVTGIAILSGVTVVLLFIKGLATYGHTVILSKISNAILANNQRRLFAKLMSESIGFYSDAAFLRIPGAADIGRKIHHRRPDAADQRRRARRAAAGQPDLRDGDAGSGAVVHRPRGGAAGDADPAQAGEAHQGPRPQPVHRQRRHHGDHAGIAAGHPHGEGLHARSGHAAADRREHRGRRAQRQQDGAGLQPLQPADGNARRLCGRRLPALWRLQRGGARRHARTVFLLHDRVPAGDRAGQAAGAAQHRPQQPAGRRPHAARNRRQPGERARRRRQAGAETLDRAGRVPRRQFRLPAGRAGAEGHELRRRARQDHRSGRPLRRRQVDRAGAAAAALRGEATAKS